MANNIQIVISAVDKATAGIKGVWKELEGFAERNRKSFQRMAIWGTAAFWSLIAISKKTTDAFKAQERAEARLEQIARQVSGATDEQIQGFKDLASQLQAVWVVWDEVIISGQSQLASFTKNADVVSLLSKDLADLAVATYGVDVSQEQAIQTANMLWKAMTWQLGAMTRAWILVSEEYAEAFEKANTEMEKAEIISKIVSENYWGVNEAMRNTAEGWAQALSNAWGDMQEQIWGALIPILNYLVATIQPVIENITKWVAENEDLTQKIILWTTAIAWIIAALWTLWLAIIPIKIAITSLWTIFVAFTAIVKWVWVALAFLAANPIGALIVAIVAIIAVIALWVKNWEELSMTISYLSGVIKDNIMSNFAEAKDWATLLWQDMWEAIQGFMMKSVGWLTDKFQAIKDFIQGNFAEAKDWASLLWQDMWEAIQNIMMKAVDWLTDKFQSLKEFIQGIFDFANQMYDRITAIGRVASEAASDVGRAASGVVSGVGDRISGAVSGVTNMVTGGRALWWPVQGGRSYLVGERWPELFTPWSSGLINPNPTGGGITINMGWVVVQKEADENRLVEKMKMMLTREAKNFNIWIV